MVQFSDPETFKVKSVAYKDSDVLEAVEKIKTAKTKGICSTSDLFNIISDGNTKLNAEELSILENMDNFMMWRETNGMVQENQFEIVPKEI